VKIPLIVSKLKGQKRFQLHYTCSNRHFSVFLPRAFSIPFSSFSDVAEVRSYFASTVPLWVEGVWYMPSVWVIKSDTQVVIRFGAHITLRLGSRIVRSLHHLLNAVFAFKGAHTLRNAKKKCFKLLNYTSLQIFNLKFHIVSKILKLKWQYMHTCLGEFKCQCKRLATLNSVSRKLIFSNEKQYLVDYTSDLLQMFHRY
jgi:hypothetical protein